MPFSFPSSPSVGATSTQNGRQYQWTGYAWELVAASGGSGLSWSSVPASATAAGTAGQIAYDGSYFYLASATNTWKRAAISTWVPFVPSALTGLQLWLDASDGASLYDETSGGSVVTAGGLVARWQDKSANARHFTASGSARPTLTASGLNGKSVVTFDGSDQMTNGNNIINRASLTVCAVVQRSSGAYGGYITSHSNDDSPALVTENGNLAGRGRGDSTGTASFAVSPTAFTGPAVASLVINSWSPFLYVNGAFVVSAAAGTTQGSEQTTSIGTYRINAANFLNGYIAEMIVYDSALSATDRATVEAYLMSKWGIA